MPDLEARIELLKSENAELREMVILLQAALGRTNDVPFGLSLTGKESGVLAVMMKREVATKEVLMMALYDDRANDREVPEPKIVDVFVCKMRKKLQQHGIHVETVWGVGYRLSPKAKATINAMLSSQRGELANQLNPS